MRIVRSVVLTSVLLLGLPALAAQASEARVLVADAAPVPQGTVWSAPARHIVATLYFQPTHGTELQALLRAQQTIGNPLYHAYLPRGAFAQRFGVDARTLRQVVTYLHGFHLDVGPLQANHLAVEISGNTADVARAFQARLRRGTVAHHSFTVFTQNATLPATLGSHIAGLTGLSRLLIAHHADVVRHNTYGAAATCPGPSTASTNYGTITPSQQGTLFGLTPLWASNHTGHGQTIAVYSLTPYGPNAIQAFFTCFGLSLSSLTNVVMPNASSQISQFNEADQEPTMDIEQAAVLAPGAAIVNYLGVNDNVGPTALYAQIANDDTASIVTTSWGICEAQSDAAAETPIFSQMAAQGQTVFAASGDSGSADCYDPNQSGSTTLAVDDPASQADVTGVGGLTVGINANTVIPATYSVWNDGQGAGGGGYSSVTPRPSWQVAAGLATTGSNATKRAVPDLSVMADPSTGFGATWTGFYDNQTVSWTGVGGTSIGAPIMAAITADAADACGPSTRLGLINPRLYAMAAAHTGFIDVTTGSNDLFSSGGYRAGVGYDPASGLGTIDPATFVTAICAQQPSASLSSVTLPSSAVSLDSSGGLISVTLKSVTGQPIAGAALTVTAKQNQATVTVTPVTTVTNANGVATFQIQSTHSGVASVTVLAGAVQLSSGTVSFSAPWVTTDITGTVAKLGSFLGARTAQATAGTVVVARTSTNHIKIAGPGVSPAVDLTVKRATFVSTATPSAACVGNRCDVAITAGTHLDVAMNALGAPALVDLSAKYPSLPTPVGSPVLLAGSTIDTVVYTTSARALELVTLSTAGLLLSATNLSQRTNAPSVTGYPVAVMTSSGPVVAASTSGSTLVFTPGVTWHVTNLSASLFGSNKPTVSGDPTIALAMNAVVVALHTTNGDTLIATAPVSGLTTWTGQDVSGRYAMMSAVAAGSPARSLVMAFAAGSLTLLVNGPSWRPLAWDTFSSNVITFTQLLGGAIPVTQSGGHWVAWTF